MIQQPTFNIRSTRTSWMLTSILSGVPIAGGSMLIKHEATESSQILAGVEHGDCVPRELLSCPSPFNDLNCGKYVTIPNIPAQNLPSDEDLGIDSPNVGIWYLSSRLYGMVTRPVVSATRYTPVSDMHGSKQ